MGLEKTEPLNLYLSAKRLQWREDDPSAYEDDQAFKDARLSVLQRDGNRCQACGFRAPKYQEVHHLDDNHSNHAPSNLATLCLFCHMCFHIGRAGSMDEAVLIWLPEISQVDLHHIVRTCLVAECFEEKIAKRPAVNERAKQKIAGDCLKHTTAMFDMLLSRQDDAQKRLGTSKPDDIANIMLDLNDKEFAELQKGLHGIRLMSTGKRISDTGENIMPRIVASWMAPDGTGPYSLSEPFSWPAKVKLLDEQMRAGS